MPQNESVEMTTSDHAPAQKLAVPEMGFDVFDPLEASRLVQEFGCVIVRGDEECKALAAGLRENAIQTGMISTSGGPAQSGALWAADPDITNLQLLPYKFFQNSKIYSFLRDYFQHDYFMSANNGSSSFRSVFPDPDIAKSNGVAFHQDRAPLELIPFLAFWMHLDPEECGRDAPGLALVPGYKDGWQKHGRDETNHYFYMENEDSIEDRYEVPVLTLGDIVIFDPHCPHASYVGETMTKSRSSADFRVWKYMNRGGNSLKHIHLQPMVLNERHMIAPRSMFGEEFGRELPPSTLAHEAPQLVYDVYEHGPDAGTEQSLETVERLFYRLDRSNFHGGAYEAGSKYTRARDEWETSLAKFINTVEDLIENNLMDGPVFRVFDGADNPVPQAQQVTGEEETDSSAEQPDITTAFLFTPDGDPLRGGTVTKIGVGGKSELKFTARRDSFGNFLGLFPQDAATGLREAAE